MYNLILIHSTKVSFIIVHLIAVIIFAILYNIIDKYYNDDIYKNGVQYKRESSKIPFSYYLRQSLITQSTVGYSEIPTYKSKPYYIINTIQLMSIFLITGFFI